MLRRSAEGCTRSASCSRRASEARWFRSPSSWTAPAASHISFQSDRLGLTRKRKENTMRPIAIVLLGAAFAFSAGDPQGFYLWKSADLKMYTKSLSPKIDAKKSANQKLGENGNHY